MIFPINLSNSNTFIYDFLSNNIDVSLRKNIYSEKNILLEILKISNRQKGYIDYNFEVFLQISFFSIHHENFIPSFISVLPAGIQLGYI
jgi:hypothetical protein